MRKQIHDNMIYKEPKDMKYDFDKICNLLAYPGGVKDTDAHVHEFGTIMIWVMLSGFDGLITENKRCVFC